MNKDQTKHYRMFLTVQETLDANTELWNHIPMLLDAKIKLDELIQRIAGINENALTDSKAISSNKSKALENLIAKTLTLSGILQAYAAVNDDIELAYKADLTKSDISRARETDIEALISPIIKEAQNQLSNLADYGLNEETLIEVETSLDDFKALIGMPRTIRNQAFAAITLMEELIDTGSELIKAKLDKLMIRFKFTNTGFFSEYERARTLID